MHRNRAGSGRLVWWYHAAALLFIPLAVQIWADLGTTLAEERGSFEQLEVFEDADPFRWAAAEPNNIQAPAPGRAFYCLAVPQYHFQTVVLTGHGSLRAPPRQHTLY